MKEGKKMRGAECRKFMLVDGRGVEVSVGDLHPHPFEVFHPAKLTSRLYLDVVVLMR